MQEIHALVPPEFPGSELANLIYFPKNEEFEKKRQEEIERNCKNNEPTEQEIAIEKQRIIEQQENIRQQQQKLQEEKERIEKNLEVRKQQIELEVEEQNRKKRRQLAKKEVELQALQAKLESEQQQSQSNSKTTRNEEIIRKAYNMLNSLKKEAEKLEMDHLDIVCPDENKALREKYQKLVSETQESTKGSKKFYGIVGSLAGVVVGLAASSGMRVDDARLTSLYSIGSAYGAFAISKEIAQYYGDKKLEELENLKRERERELEKVAIISLTEEIREENKFNHYYKKYTTEENN